jgi:hypothetical protein
MQANGAQLRELAALYDAGHLRPVIDKTFPFDQTLEALAYVEQGRANGKVVITLDRRSRTPTATCVRTATQLLGGSPRDVVCADTRLERLDWSRPRTAVNTRGVLSE